MDSMLMIFLAIGICFCVELSNASNILAIFPLPFFSHFKTFRPLLEEIVSRGHNLTLLSSFSLNDRFQANYTRINLEQFNKNIYFENNVNFMKLLKMSIYENEVALYQVVYECSEKVLQSTKVQELISSNSNFDLILVELFHSNDAFFVFGKKFNAPVISVISLILYPNNNWILNNPFPAAHVSCSAVPLTENMQLVDRMINSWFNLYTISYYEFVHLPRIQNLINKYFHFEKGNEPQIRDIMKNISVNLVSAHYSLGYAKPDSPNVINVAGIHFTAVEPLPMEIQKFMDEANDGVIYLSLGSAIKPTIVEHLGEIFINSLKNLSQKVIMKWDSKLLSDIPSNFLIQEWFPQSSILNHPKCKLFITHGGLLGLMESLNASVPVIVIPFFGDQPHNAAMVEHYQIGLEVKLDNIHHELSRKVKEVLTNSKYKRNMARRSSLFHDRPSTPLDTAMFWVNYVIKHQDISYLKPTPARLMWYEFYSLDLLLTLIACIIFIMYVLKTVVIWTRQLLCNPTDSIQTRRKSKKMVAKTNPEKD